MISKYHNRRTNLSLEKFTTSLSTRKATTKGKGQNGEGRAFVGKENFWDFLFLLVAFKLLARLIFQHKGRTCFMLCANLMSRLMWRFSCVGHICVEDTATSTKVDKKLTIHFWVKVVKRLIKKSSRSTKISFFKTFFSFISRLKEVPS